MLRNLSLKLVFHVVLVCHGGLKAKEAILDHVTRVVLTVVWLKAVVSARSSPCSCGAGADYSRRLTT